MRLLRYSPLLLLCFAILGAHSCDEVSVHVGSSRVWVTEEMDLTQAAQGLNALAVETHNGEIKVAGAADAREIDVHVTKKAGGKSKEDAAACMKAIQVESGVEGSTYKLSWKWAQEKKHGWQASVAFDVKLPNEMTVSATTHNGRVALSGMVADANLLTHNGAVDVRDVAANLKATTHNGHIRVENLTGDPNVETHNGEIDIRCVASNVRARTHNGRVGVDLSDSKAINGEVVTSNGAVTVRLGDDASVQLRCRTDNGRVRANRPIDAAVARKSSLEGRIGGGDGQLEVRTNNGSITVE